MVRNIVPIWLVFAVCVFVGCAQNDPSPGRPGRDGGTGTSPGATEDAGRLVPVRDSGSATVVPGDAGPTGADSGTSERTYVDLDECSNNTAGISAEDVSRLLEGGESSGMRILYPYDGTVFPRNMLAPEIMWEGETGSAIYVHIESEFFDYYGCLAGSERAGITLPQNAWDLAGAQTAGASTPFRISISVLREGRVFGPVTTSVTIAQASIKGSIFYNSYLPAAGTEVGTSGAIYRIPPGGEAELFLGGAFGCQGCHSVSANGTRLSSSNVALGAAYPITPDSTPNPTSSATVPNAAFAALSPDGSLLLSTGVRNGGPPVFGGIPGIPDMEAELRETDSGMLVANSGIPGGALMPTFSPDGTLLAFNDFGTGQGRSLAVMDFDAPSRSATNLRTVYTDSEQYVGWPFFLPDNRAIIFSRTTNSQYSGAGAGVIPGISLIEVESELYMVDIASGRTTMLSRAMGYDEAGNPYVPFGEQDLHHTYYPTVSPVPAGGYFWLFFDTIRHYGNRGRFRQLWGAAVRVASSDRGYETDLSFPPFYVSGQGFATGNHRAFTALDPCRANGNSCESGVDCCSGFCTDGVCDEPDRCAMIGESCEVDSDCCGGGADGVGEISCLPPGICEIILF